jgi:ribonuclease P protein subunit RPR2
MAKGKGTKGKGSVSHKAVNSRASFLYQAASFLAIAGSAPTATNHDLSTDSDNPSAKLVSKTSFRSSLSRQLLSHLSVVAEKSQIRLSSSLKHTICKRCNALLIDGSTCVNTVENASKGGAKPWADVFVRTCAACSCARRFPLAVERQKPRRHRQATIDQDKG